MVSKGYSINLKPGYYFLIGGLQEKRAHGIVSLSQDSSGTFLTASCKDNRFDFEYVHTHNFT